MAGIKMTVLAVARSACTRLCSYIGDVVYFYFIIVFFFIFLARGSNKCVVDAMALCLKNEPALFFCVGRRAGPPEALGQTLRGGWGQRPKRWCTKRTRAKNNK